MTASAPTGATPNIEALGARAIEVAKMATALPPAADVIDAIGALVDTPDPRKAIAQRRVLTSLAARVAAVNAVLLGMLGEHDLTLADGDDLACGLAARGILLPKRRGRGSKGRR